MANSAITVGALNGAQWRVHNVNYGATISIDGTLYEHVNIGVLTGNLTFNLTGTPSNNKSIDVYVQQDATGGRTITLGANISLPTDISSLPYSTAANAGTIIKFQYVATKSKWYVISCLPGLS